MSGEALPHALRSLILHHMPTMDHVAVLVAIRASAELALSTQDIMRTTRLESGVVEAAARDLVSSSILGKDGDMYRYAPTPELKDSLGDLVDMYRTKPVTLVRALYDRPARAVTSFADAFRVRKTT